MLRYGKYRDGWAEKFLGRLPQLSANHSPTATPRIWLHAVSVGEVLQLQVILNELLEHRPDAEIVVTTTTITGFAIAQEKFPQHQICYCPLDFSWATRNAVKRLQPNLVVLVELELWPNLIRSINEANIPLALINGRISENSFEGYRKIRPLMSRLLQRFQLLAVQNETYSERLKKLGAPKDRIKITGSIKFDGVTTNRNNPHTTELRTAFGLDCDEPVFIAGSTHAPEEEIALNAWQAARKQFPNLRLILIPRHKERFNEVAQQITARNLPLLRRTETKQPNNIKPTANEPTIPPILLLDTLGELSACWGLADIAFVGGSLTPRGGQNMLEPAAYGATVLFGPQTRNFHDIVEILLHTTSSQSSAAQVVANESELITAICNSLANPTAAQQQGKHAQKIVLEQQGATQKTVQQMLALLTHYDSSPKTNSL